MQYFKDHIYNTWEFLVHSKAYFRDVLLMHGLMLFILIPLLSSSTKFVLAKGNINYISSDNLLTILTKHPVVTLLLLFILLFILLAIYFEFTFLLLSMYFIKKQQTVTLSQLLKMTLLQLKKLRPSIFLFFLFYFLLVLPLGGMSFNSDLLAKVKIPAFIMDFIFANRVVIITSFIIFYVLLLYLGVRLIFALPEMILRDRPFKLAVKESFLATKKNLLTIVTRFIFIGGCTLAVTAVGFSLVIASQRLVEQFFPEYSLISAVFAMTLLQFFLLLNSIFSTVGIFFIIIDFMDDEGFLPAIPPWFDKDALPKRRFKNLQQTLMLVTALFFGIGVSLYNLDYLNASSKKVPITTSHRGVSDANGLQNTLPALENTSQDYHPNYVEMDVQLTKDQQFVVLHDFTLKGLTGINKKPGELTLAQLQDLAIGEGDYTGTLASFDEYLADAQTLDQKLLIEIKTQEKDVSELVTLFLNRYHDVIVQEDYLIQSLSYDVVEEIKKQAPELLVGYILPFNVVGPPNTTADFLTMEYSTINRNFIEAAQKDGKKVFVWTPNSSDAIERMIFYGVDGIITDQMSILNQEVTSITDQTTYSDKLTHFVIGVG
ncbi:MAG: glycerophosphoryl diester phosphodiesterase membrane domain-containing protein [Enterococcus sp.]